MTVRDPCYRVPESLRQDFPSEFGSDIKSPGEALKLLSLTLLTDGMGTEVPTHPQVVLDETGFIPCSCLPLAEHDPHNEEFVTDLIHQHTDVYSCGFKIFSIS